MAITPTNLTNGTINGAYITNSNGYNIAADTIYGLPAHIWHSMSNREQCQYADRYRYEEKRKAELECRRQEHERYAYLGGDFNAMALATPKHTEPTFLTNTKLLLTGAEL